MVSIRVSFFNSSFSRALLFWFLLRLWFLLQSFMETLPKIITLHIRLDWNNYMFWCTKVLANVKAHGFEEFIFCEVLFHSWMYLHPLDPPTILRQWFLGTVKTSFSWVDYLTQFLRVVSGMGTAVFMLFRSGKCLMISFDLNLKLVWWM